jgi:site-specific recombinase XerD
VHDYVSARLNSARGRYRTSNLSPLLRFLFTSGRVRSDLRAFLPKISRAKPLPSILSEAERDRVLAASRGESKKDVRNYAIVVLLNDLGLRAGEIRTLKKDAINWTALTIKVVRKGGAEDCLPLTNRAAKALAAYLKISVTNNDLRYVFGRINAGYGPFSSSSGISVIITRLLRKCGLKHCRSAAHVFRHSFATDMLNRGAPINQISALLGHKGIDSTRIYTRVSVPMLRTVSVPWVGPKHSML